MTVPTPRLDLVPLSAELVAALVGDDLRAATKLAGFPLEPDTFAGDAAVLARRHAQLLADPNSAPWLLHAAVRRSPVLVVGRVGFHAPPDSEGTVEIGYTVSPAQRGQGLATEMAVGLIRWGAGQGARACLASVRPDNLPSLAIVERLGFVRVGEQIDEVDGLEWVFTLPLTGALPTYDARR